MKKFPNKIITGFFIFTFGILWFFSTKYYVNPTHFRIVVYDKRNGMTISGGVRTKFSTPEVAHSYIEEYQKKYPDQKFFVEPIYPKFKRRIFS